MDEIINHLKESLADELFSKDEKRSLKEIVSRTPLSPDQLIFLRSKVYDLATEKATETNFQFILEWMKQANNALSPRPKETSEVYFSPGESCRSAIIQQIEAAANQLKICVFTISDDMITNAILTAHKKGIDIKLITDNDKSLDVGSDIEQMAKEGVKVKIDKTSNHMHHKFMVADRQMALTGSYNWTLSAARYNHENIMLTTEAGIIKSFLSEFDRLWNEMEDYNN